MRRSVLVSGFVLVGAALTVGGVWSARNFLDRAGPIPPRPTLSADPNDHGIGRLVSDLEFVDLQGRSGRLSEEADCSALVVVMRDTGCPICKKVGPKIADIEQQFAAHKVRFLFVNVNPADTSESMSAEIKSMGFTGRYVADPERKFASALGALSTTDAFVIDSSRTLIYRGAVDDQYGVGFTRPKVEHEYLIDAIIAHLGGMRPDVEATIAPGCLLPADQSVTRWAEPDPITYHNRISRIVQRNCISCHRTGGMGPFALETIEQIRARSQMVKYVLDEKIMPAWPLSDGYGPWKHNRSLSESDLTAIDQWIKDEFPAGDEADAAKVKVWDDNAWEIGTPDLVLEFPDEIVVPATGFIDYQFVFLNTRVPHDKWVQAIEIKPAVRDVIHHLAMWVGDKDATPESEDSFRGQHGGKFDKKGFMAIIVPGQGPTVFPPGMAKYMPEGAWLKFQMHYTPNGNEVRDRPRVAFKFTDRPPIHEIFTNVCISRDFVIPARAVDHPVSASFRFKEAGSIRAFHPHMHMRGKSFQYELTYPNGEKRVVLKIDKWSFKWQLVYELVEPIEVPAGTIMTATATYDNSSANPMNPDPTVDVKFGRLSTDEMMLGYFEWYKTQPMKVDEQGNAVAEIIDKGR